MNNIIVWIVFLFDKMVDFWYNLNNENNEYYQKITELTKQVEELNNRPQQTETTNPNIDSLNKAILAVQETADRMKSVAKEESRMIIEDAKRNANSIVHEALVKAEKTEIETAMLKKNIKISMLELVW